VRALSWAAFVHGDETSDKKFVRIRTIDAGLRGVGRTFPDSAPRETPNASVVATLIFAVAATVLLCIGATEMKIVLRHKLSGRYYNAPGRWVRRADNALTFDDVVTAREFSRVNHLEGTQPVQRLAPYMMALLQKRRRIWDVWNGGRVSEWFVEHAGRLSRN
jgi:hypothetical protein